MPRKSTPLGVPALEDRVVPTAQLLPANHVVVGADAGEAPVITVINADTDQVAFTFEAYDKSVTTGVQVDLGDFTGDGVPDIVTAPGVGGGPHVRIFDGVTGQQLQTALGNFFAGDPAARLGVDVTTADFTGDGLDDLFAVVPADVGVAYKLFDGSNGNEVPIIVGRFSTPSGETLAIQATSSDGLSRNQICIRDPFPTRQPSWSGGVREMTPEELANAAVNYNFGTDKINTRNGWNPDGVRAALIAAGRAELAEWLLSKQPNSPSRSNVVISTSESFWGSTYVTIDDGMITIHISANCTDEQAAAEILGIINSTWYYDAARTLYRDWLATRMYGKVEAGLSFEEARAEYNKYLLSTAARLGLDGYAFLKAVYTLTRGAGLADIVIELTDKNWNELTIIDSLQLLKIMRATGSKSIFIKNAKGNFERVTEEQVGRVISLKVIQDSCFAAGTPLLTSSGSKVIEDIRVGDKILSRSELEENGIVEEKKVEEVFQRLAELLEVTVHGQVIRTTAEHPFWVVGQGWLAARELGAGMKLLSHQDEAITIQAVNFTNTWATVYNLRVADHHTYFVGSEDWGFSVWAHNQYLAELLADGTYVVRDSRSGKLLVSSPGVPKILPKGMLTLRPNRSRSD